MNLFKKIERLISSLPYDISSVKACYDETITKCQKARPRIFILSADLLEDMHVIKLQMFQ